jgi:hypothetical protein
MTSQTFKRKEMAQRTSKYNPYDYTVDYFYRILSSRNVKVPDYIENPRTYVNWVTGISKCRVSLKVILITQDTVLKSLVMIMKSVTRLYCVKRVDEL